MTDKEKIRNIIELFIAWNGETEAIDIANLDSAVDFIADSLQEEPAAPKVLEDMLNAKTAAESLGISQEEHDRIVDELIYGKEPELADDLQNKEEEPVSEDLNEAAIVYNKKANFVCAGEIPNEHFIAGALWQKEQAMAEIQAQSMALAHGCPKETVSEDLEEELDAYIKDNFTIEKDFLEKYGLEEKDYMYSMDKSDMLKMIRHFTNNYKVPTSDDLEEAAKLCVSDSFCITNEEDWDEHAVDALNIFKIAAQWQKQQDKETIELAEDHAMLAGMEKMKGQMMKNLWKPADGDDLPEIDREVIVLTQHYPLEGSEYAVYFAHRPNPDGWDGKSIVTGKTEHYTPKTYDKGGWNIPDVRFWLDVELPKE